MLNVVKIDSAILLYALLLNDTMAQQYFFMYLVDRWYRIISMHILELEFMFIKWIYIFCILFLFDE